MLLLSVGGANAQNKIKDGTVSGSSILPNTDAILDLESNKRGLLIPRVLLTATTAFAPLSAHVAGMTVYNTATAGNVTPGYYYNDGTQWIRIAYSDDNDLRVVGTRNHITKDAGVGSNGSSAGTGVDNIAVGSETGNALTTGEKNVFIGSMAGKFNTTGANNVSIGNIALTANTSGDYNTAIGSDALSINTTGGYNTATGGNALNHNASGNNNTANGYAALYNNSGGSSNTANGQTALYNNTTGNDNVATGMATMKNNASGSHNVANGMEALGSNSSGDGNTAIGRSAIFTNLTGDYNSAVGFTALYTNYSGTGNVAMGYKSLFYSATGSKNVAIGYESGISITSGSNNTFLGNGAGNNGSQKADATNSMALGNGAYTTKDNQVVLGNSSITETLLQGNVGINTATTPTNALHISAASNPLRLEGLQESDINTTMTVNASGEVTKASATGAIIIPVGTTAQRPEVGVLGMVRFNTTLSKLEFYTGTAWVSF